MKDLHKSLKFNKNRIGYYQYNIFQIVPYRLKNKILKNN
jgi:hypothetical protein